MFVQAWKFLQREERSKVLRDWTKFNLVRGSAAFVLHGRKNTQEQVGFLQQIFPSWS